MPEKRSTSLIFKFSILFLLLMLVILITFAFLLVSILRISLKQTEEMVRKEHERIVSTIDRYLDSLEDIGFSVSYSSVTQDYLQKAPVYRVTGREEMKSLYLSVTTMMQDVQGFYLYDEEFDGILRFGQCIEEHQREDNGITLGEGVKYSNGYVTGTGEPVVSMIYPIHRMEETRLVGDIIGYAGLTIKRNGLAELVSDNGAYRNRELILTDRTGKVLVSNLGKNTADKEVVEEWKRNPEKFIYVDTNIERAGWKLISIMPKGGVAQEYEVIMPMMTVAAGVVIIILLILIMLVRFKILKPIRSLSRFMERVEEGSENVRYHTVNRDEFGIMAESMNSMLDAVHNRSEELRISETRRLNAELARQQMEILAYRNQINPHFIYNTLECMRGIAFYRGAPEIAEMTQSLSGMLRYAVKGEGGALLEEEIRYIEEYYRIIQYRFGERIIFRIRVPEKLRELRVIKLCLQPLVENSVSHGLEMNTEQGIVDISGYREKDTIILQVQDNGEGMDNMMLQQIRERIKKVYTSEDTLSETEQHIGVLNIARRLFLNYGDKSGMMIESVRKKGTLVTLRMPVEGEEFDV